MFLEGGDVVVAKREVVELSDILVLEDQDLRNGVSKI